MLSIYKFIQIIFCFFLVFSYELERVYISNIIFFVLFLLLTVDKLKLHSYVKNRTSNTLLLFIVSVTISTLIYYYHGDTFETRSLIQYIFNFQYLFLIYYLDLDYELIKKWLIKFSILYACLLIIAFFLIGQNIQEFKTNTFISNYFPGWPNGIPLIFFTVVFFTRHSRYSLFYKIFFLIAILLTGSRGGLLGFTLVLLLPLYENYKKLIISLTSISIILLLTFNSINLDEQNPENRLLRTYDRLDIFLTTYSLVKERPLLGYGGNTIDQLQNVPIDHRPILNWGHTHNLLLEVMLRYGIISLILFSLFLYYRIKDIYLSDYKYMFMVLLILSLFQIFIRDFIFLYLLIFYSSYPIYLNKKNNIKT